MLWLAPAEPPLSAPIISLSSRFGNQVEAAAAVAVKVHPCAARIEILRSRRCAAGLVVRQEAVIVHGKDKVVNLAPKKMGTTRCI